MKKQGTFSMSLTRGVVVAGPEATAMEIAGLMKESDIGAVVIMEGDRIAGIVSERDIVRRIVADGKDASCAKASEFMTANVMTADYKDGLKKIYEILCSVKFRHLPIVDNGKLVGIASQRDLLYGPQIENTPAGDA